MKLDVIGWLEATSSVPSITLQFLGGVFEDTMGQLVDGLPLKWTSAPDLRPNSATAEGNMVIDVIR